MSLQIETDPGKPRDDEIDLKIALQGSFEAKQHCFGFLPAESGQNNAVKGNVNLQRFNATLQ